MRGQPWLWLIYQVFYSVSMFKSVKSNWEPDLIKFFSSFFLLYWHRWCRKMGKDSNIRNLFIYKLGYFLTSHYFSLGNSSTSKISHCSLDFYISEAFEIICNTLRWFFNPYKGNSPNSQEGKCFNTTWNTATLLITIIENSERHPRQPLTWYHC